MTRLPAEKSTICRCLLAIQNERMVHGELLTVENNLLPSLTAKGYIEAQQINLAALGFKPSEVADFGLIRRRSPRL